jgi:hypothetical protein
MMTKNQCKHGVLLGFGCVHCGGFAIKKKRIHKQLKVYILVVKMWKDTPWEIIPATGNKLIAYTDLAEAKKDAASYDSFVTGVVKAVPATWRQ